MRTAEMILQDPTTSEWLRMALRAALLRDPVDAANDAECLRWILMQRLSGALDAEARGQGAGESPAEERAPAALTPPPGRRSV